MDFPLIDLMDEHACYAELLAPLHPDGLACPRRGAGDRLGIHRRHRDPILDYQCGRCRRVFNASTGTPLQGIRRPPAELLLIVRGIAQAAPTAQLARELGRDRKHLLEPRHRLRGNALLRLGRNPLGDAVVEADGAYVNAGEKRHPAPGSRRSAAAAVGPPPRARDLRQRPAPGRRRRRAGVG
jgi:transposase-like protein